MSSNQGITSNQLTLLNIWALQEAIIRIRSPLKTIKFIIKFSGFEYDSSKDTKKALGRIRGKWDGLLLERKSQISDKQIEQFTLNQKVVGLIFKIYLEVTDEEIE